MRGHKIIEGLKGAIRGDFPRITIDGQTWVREKSSTIVELVEVLENVEAVMTIVAPRSDKAAYLECLDQVRKAIRKTIGKPTESGAKEK